MIKNKFPKAVCVGIADGAKSNWEYLKNKTDEQTIDFWHASGCLGRAAEAMFSKNNEKCKRRDWIDNSCHKLKHNIGAATRLLNEMKEFKRKHRLVKQRRDELTAAIKYFENNKSKVRYAQNQDQNFPIGSGVTKASCKTSIKQRFCNSGMRWKEKGTAAVISLRSMTHKVKMFACHLHVQMALISQGLSQYLSTEFNNTVWSNFGSWLRTVPPGVPASVQVTQESLRNSLRNFRETLPKVPEWQKFAKSIRGTDPPY